VDRGPRVEDDDRLAGVWLRPHPADYVWFAPVQLADGALGICRVQLRLEPDAAHRRTFWAVFGRGGLVLQGDFDLPAVASWQVLAQVERTIGEEGVRLR
jgi:hypothetical protein